MDYPNHFKRTPRWRRAITLTPRIARTYRAALAMMRRDGPIICWTIRIGDHFGEAPQVICNDLRILEDLGLVWRGKIGGVGEKRLYVFPSPFHGEQNDLRAIGAELDKLRDLTMRDDLIDAIRGTVLKVQDARKFNGRGEFCRPAKIIADAYADWRLGKTGTVWSPTPTSMRFFRDAARLTEGRLVPHPVLPDLVWHIGSIVDEWSKRKPGVFFAPAMLKSQTFLDGFIATYLGELQVDLRKTAALMEQAGMPLWAGESAADFIDQKKETTDPQIQAAIDLLGRVGVPRLYENENKLYRKERAALRVQEMLEREAEATRREREAPPPAPPVKKAGRIPTAWEMWTLRKFRREYSNRIEPAEAEYGHLYPDTVEPPAP